MDIFNPRQRMIAAALMEITHEEGKFDWGVGANGAHYVPASENPFLPQNIRCEECVFYADDGGCAIVAGEIEDNAVCKFWTIPEGEIIQVMPVSDVMDIVDEASGDTPIYMGLIDDMKSVMTMDEARAIVQEYAQLHPDKASIVYESIEQDLMSGKITKEELLGQSSKATPSTAEQDEIQKQIVMTAKRYLAFLDS